MARTLNEMKEELADYAGASNPRNKELADRSLGDAVQKFNRRGAWWFMFTVTDASGDTVLVDGDRDYAEPTDFAIHVSSALLNEDETRVSSVIRYINEEDFFRLWWQTTDTEGRPWVMTRVRTSSLILFNRDPGPAYDTRHVRHAYFKRLSMPASGTMEFGIPDEAEDYLFQEALWRLKRYARIPGGYDRDKQIASDTEKELLAARPSIDITALGFTR